MIIGIVDDWCQDESERLCYAREIHSQPTQLGTCFKSSPAKVKRQFHFGYIILRAQRTVTALAPRNK